jgi:hypothetical protein
MEEKQFIQYIIKDKSKKGTSKAEFQNLMKMKAHQILLISIL